MSEYEVVRVNGKLTIKKKPQPKKPKAEKPQEEKPKRKVKGLTKDKKAYMKKYREEHKEEIAETSKLWYQRHKAEKAAYNHERYINNRDQILAKQKEYREKESSKERRRQYYEEHRKERIASVMKWYYKNQKKAQAKQRAYYRRKKRERLEGAAK